MLNKSVQNNARESITKGTDSTHLKYSTYLDTMTMDDLQWWNGEGQEFGDSKNHDNDDIQITLHTNQSHTGTDTDLD